MILVKDLISFLQTQDAEMPVAIEMYSEQCLLELDGIRVEELCDPRNDGWIQNKRPDKPSRPYLIFPGN